MKKPTTEISAAYPDMSGLSPRNLLFMRSFAAAYPDAQIVKQAVSLLPWEFSANLKRDFEELGV